MNEFRTKSLPLAAYLLATGSLPYLGCRPVEDALRFTVEFAFDDPQQAGPDLDFRFKSGGQCPALAYHAALRRLRAETNHRDTRRGR